ncbi:NusG domain II-containing protein [Anaerotruncus massiliensis (ex Liu et al. 2021)]|uniref:NusG domain II-containing protein n=2 Tax=Anaerotruncus TaxID=244127 RepID=A0A498CP85_9FIRM|nr:NusG domain II-containing protein [Anaerotruncus massiliensis (ex Togo et al. 2019)]RLL13186.1 NusG domain II-containing protein [Anaerotruncus massiliensis (ex Liu et al. 2021)]
MKMKKIEWIILAAVVAVCAGLALFFYWPRSGDTVAVVSVDGTALYRIDLSRTARPYTFRIEEETGRPVSFEVADGRVRFVEVTCPDHICERTGWCGAPGERAVCMPNRTTLVCYERGELPPDDGVRWITESDHP